MFPFFFFFFFQPKDNQHLLCEWRHREPKLREYVLDAWACVFVNMQPKLNNTNDLNGAQERMKKTVRKNPYQSIECR